MLKIARHSVTSFEQAADRLYDPEDLRRGYINVPDRRRNLHRAALVTLSVGAVISALEEGRIKSVAEAIHAVSEMKKVAKGQPGSYVAIDRRKVSDG
ncbi:hypothetical protein AB0J83_03595 [Actinoplanes sp. NPDC049596]